MNEKTMKQIEELKSQKYGVEIEMYNITREKAAKTAAEFFGTGRYESTEHIHGYRAWSAWDSQGREWMFERDCSIIAKNDLERCEMVTPILVYSDMEMLQELVRQLRHAGGKSDPEHMCGVHCHVDGAGHTPQSLRNMANLMASHEEIILTALRIDRSRIGEYCRTVDPDFIRRLNKEKPQTMAKLADIWYEECGGGGRRDIHYERSRYHCLNYHSFFTHANVEFRYMNFESPSAEKRGGLHAGRLKAFIQLCLGISAEAKRLRTASPKQPQLENPKFAMRTWLIRMGFVGDEFATARDILTRDLPGDTAFRFGRAA